MSTEEQMIQEQETVVVAAVTKPQFTKKEYDLYERQPDKAHFASPELEHAWASSQTKICSKCACDKSLTEYNGNTSGCDGFASDGKRLRRPECGTCTKKVSEGKGHAMKMAKDLGIPYKAPDGTTCAICTRLPTKGNGLVFDHCHEKNIFRGYLCNACNRSCGVLGDDVDGLLKTLNYLLQTEKALIVQNEDGTLYRA